MSVPMLLERYHEQHARRHRIPRHERPHHARPHHRSRRPAGFELSLGFISLFAAGTLVAGSWWYVQSTEPGAAGGPTTNDRNASTVPANQAPGLAARASVVADPDGDGLTDELEDLYGTDRQAVDSDRDGFDDGLEIGHGFEPLNAARGIRTVDSALIDRLARQTLGIVVLSSGRSTDDRERYYLTYDGRTTTYYGSDGSVVATCEPGVEPTGTCATIPNTVRTDFSRMFGDSQPTDTFHIPF